MNLDSSGSKETGHVPDGRGSIPGRGRIKTESGAHPASKPPGTGGFFPSVKLTVWCHRLECMEICLNAVAPR